MPKKLFTCSQLSDQRWGIFCGEQLLATIGSHQEAKLMVRHLQERVSAETDPNLGIPVSRQISFKRSDHTGDYNLAMNVIS